MAKFKIGDVVTLTSGGNEMTIIGIYENDPNNYHSSVGYEVYSQKFGGASSTYYGCAWFENGLKKVSCYLSNSYQEENYLELLII